MSFLKAVFSLIVFFAAVSALYSDPVLSGNINTVNPGSGFNALRNPSLMSSSNENSQGLIFLYSGDIDTTVEGKVALTGMTDEKISSDSEEQFNGSVFFSSVTQYGRGSFGFGIKQNSDNQFLLSSSESVIEGVFPGPVGFKSVAEEEKREAGFGLVFSYALSLDRNESVGFFIENNYYSRKLTKDIAVYNDAVLISDRDFESERLGFSFIPGFGLHVSEGRHEAGFMLRMGEVMFEKQEYTLDDSITMFSGSEKTPLFYYFNRGAEAIAGYGYSPSRDLGFYAEAGFMFPFLKKEIEKNDETLAKQESFTRLDYGYLLSCGLESALSRSIVFNSGLMFLMVKNRSYVNNKKTGDSEFIVMQINAGLDIKYSEEINLLFGAEIYRFDADFIAKNPNMTMELDAESTFLSLSAGVSRIY